MSRKEPFASRASRTTEPHPSPAFPAFPPAEAESEGSDVAASRPPPIEAACAMAASSDDDTSSLASFAQKALKARSSESRSLAGPGATPSANPPGEDSAREVSRARSSADSSLPSPRFLSNSSTVAEADAPAPISQKASQNPFQPDWKIFTYALWTGSTPLHTVSPHSKLVHRS